MRPLSIDKLNIVISRLHSGQTTCQISSSTGVSIGTISKIHSEHFSDLPKSSGSYPVKLSPANVCHAVNFITSGKAETAEQGNCKEVLRQEAEMPPPINISGDSDDEWNSRISLETMDTDWCIQKLVRTDQEGSEHAQRKIEETIQYWVAQEKKAAMNYHCALELNNTVSNKRVQQLYSEDQP